VHVADAGYLRDGVLDLQQNRAELRGKLVVEVGEVDVAFRLRRASTQSLKVAA